MNNERAGVIVVRDGRLALIERMRAGRHYWVIPGGGVEDGESVAEAAQREAEEELGLPVALGALRVRIDHAEEDGTFQRHWYFEATVESDAINMIGPEVNHGPEHGTFAAVWVELGALDLIRVLPAAVARLVVNNGGVWPDQVTAIDERA